MQFPKKIKTWNFRFLENAVVSVADDRKFVGNGWRQIGTDFARVRSGGFGGRHWIRRSLGPEWALPEGCRGYFYCSEKYFIFKIVSIQKSTFSNEKNLYFKRLFLHSFLVNFILFFEQAKAKIFFFRLFRRK